MADKEMVPSPLENGTSLNRGRYKIWKKMASGGFGMVYMASDLSGNILAIKEFLPQSLVVRERGEKKISFRKLSEERRFNDGLNSFWREADNLMSFRNERIVPILDIFEENGTSYFTMPLLPGQSFYSALKQKGIELKVPEIKNMFIDTCLGIEVLHNSGLLHLDIKPGNLWITPNKKVVIFDLGASHWNDEIQNQAHLARTPGFAAPEQHAHVDKRVLSESTDVYGVAASMYAFLLKESPEPAPRRLELFDKYKKDVTSLKYKFYNEINIELSELIDQAMNLDPNQRIQKISDFRHRLEFYSKLSNSSSYISYQNKDFLTKDFRKQI